MKRHLLILLLVASTIAVCAQHKSPRPPKEPPHHEEGRIEKILTDLTATQKTRIDLVTRETAKKVEKLRKELNNVRDSIKTYMDSPNDNTSKLFPLFELEGKLQAEISKEYYRAKTALDKVLTPDQYRRLSAHKKAHQPHDRDRDHSRGHKRNDKK